MKYILFGISFLLINSVSGQYDFRFQQEYFFGNLPSTKTEAMGRADVAIGGTVSSIFLNPAALGGIEKQEVALSTSGPFYALRRSDYYFASYGYRINPKWVAAFSVNQLAVGPTTFSTIINGINYSLDKPKSTNLALSVAAEPIDGLQVGTNVNFFNLKFFDDVSSAKKIHLDLGAIYRLDLSSSESQKQQLQFGASVTNFTGSAIKLTSPADDFAFSDLPTVGRLGIAYLLSTQIKIPGAGSGDFDLTLTTEYQNVLNNPYRTSFRLGAESVFWKVFAIRMGYFTQNLNDYGFSNNKDRLGDFTYGFGFIIPFQRLTNGKLPFRLHVDYVSLKQPPYTNSGTRLPNMRGFGFRMVYPLEDQN